MDGYQSFLPESKEKKKIPYDAEPISRSNSRKVKINVQKTNRLISLLIALVVISNVVFGALIFTLWQRKSSNTPTITTESRKDTTVPTSQNPEVTVGATSFALRSIVSVRAYFANNHDYNIGAGVIISDNNDTVTIVTNYHVVYTNTAISSRIVIYFFDDVDESNPIVCTYVGGSYNFDVVVLQFAIGAAGNENAAGRLYLASSACPATFSDSSDLSIGENAFAIGNPQGLGISHTTGSISKTLTEVQIDVNSDGNSEVMRVIQTDAAINGGNSGGGLFNASGCLIGLINSKLVWTSSDDPVEGMAYAIPANVVRGVAHNVTSNGGILKLCKLGVVLSATSYSVSETINSILYIKIKYDVSISSFSVGSVAYEAGIKAGDKLLRLGYEISTNDGTEWEWDDIDQPYTIEDNMFWFSAGQTIKLVVERNGEERTFDVVLNAGVTVS